MAKTINISENQTNLLDKSYRISPKFFSKSSQIISINETVDHSPQPVLVVNDLKHGTDKKGEIGIWIDIGTEGFFKI